MENLTFDLILSQGIFAVLFFWLLIDTKKDSKERESKYQDVINNLTDTLIIVNSINDNVTDIKKELQLSFN